MKVKGDKSKTVGSSKRSKGPAAQKSSVNKGARGKPIVWKNGQAGYQNRKIDD